MIAPDTTHIQIETPQRRTNFLIYPLPISVSGLMVLSVQILDLAAQESYSMRHMQGLNITFLPRQSNFIQLYRRNHSLRPALGWCLQHLSTCPFISLSVFTNSQFFLFLLNSASNHLTPNAVWTIWSSTTAYLIWPNCPYIGFLATAIHSYAYFAIKNKQTKKVSEFLNLPTFNNSYVFRRLTYNRLILQRYPVHGTIVLWYFFSLDTYVNSHFC